MWFYLWSFMIGECATLLGANLAIDAYAIPINCAGDPNCGSTSVFGGPVQYGTEDECYLAVPLYSTEYDWIWCQPTTITNLNGTLNLTTPCKPEFGDFTDAPYKFRDFVANFGCDAWAQSMQFCTFQNMCTAADKLHGDCSCTVDEQANHACTP